MRVNTATDCNGTARAQPENALKARLLLVLPIVPWPVRRNGISLRFAPIVDYLAQRFDLDVLVVAQGKESVPTSGPIQQCHSVTVVQAPVSTLAPWMRKIRTLFRNLVPWGAPPGSLGFASHELEQTVLRELEGKDYSAVLWATAHLNMACRIRRKYPRARFVIDICDSPTLWSARSVSTAPSPVHRIIASYNSWKWRRLETKARQIFDSVIYISPVDARAVPGGDMSRIHVIPNGIFDADAPPFTRQANGSSVIGFLGHMSYPPNVSATLRLVQRIFPRVLKELADAELLIIGRDPAPEIAQLRSPTINITGTVENIWPYIARADIFVFPMIEGAGMQNKILEAMYAGVPIVTTTIAAIGIGATSGDQLLIADTDDAIAEQVLKLLADPTYAGGLADRARSFVTQQFAWPAILPRYAAVIAPN
jgi:glycosyltransferase involved in cell wall biosynthesis